MAAIVQLCECILPEPEEQACSVLQVIQYMNNGMSVVEACRLVAVLRSSFYSILDNNPEAAAEVQPIIDDDNCEQFK